MTTDIDLFFFDSYAVVEIFKGNPNYEKYKGARAILTKCNMFEIGYFLKRVNAGQDIEAEVFSEYAKHIVDYDIKTIAKAVELKVGNKKLSMVDCIGYQIAQDFGVKFLTGDKEFENMPGVEFVK